MILPGLFTAVTLLVTQAIAHGAVTSYIIDGVAYPGYQGYSPAQSPSTIERQWSDYNPVLSVSDSKMRCNGGTSASLSAPVKAGGKVRAIWSQWTHQQGPVMVWLFKCAGAFSSCDGSGKGWFKIDQMGMTAPPLTGTSWGTAVVMKQLYWESTIPSKIADGNYLIRHELLALHQANTPQFYPECAQIVISGGGGQSPDSTYLASIPSYASASDPGVNIDIYSSTATTYTCPGPAVWS
ncbi:hypothetical protein O988_09397 [Pseudogymnoascus sp. VKM F-3808]|nr:hypothetical protein O988_09397 [Pseudogymnoascus sp. VKM F-3808]